MHPYCFTNSTLMMVLLLAPLQPLLVFSPSSKTVDHHLAFTSTSPKCELLSDLSSFPDEMKRSNVPHFEILGAPIGDLLFYAKFVAQKQSEASKLLQQLEAVGSIDPQVALLLLRHCGSYCRLVHLSRNTPSLLVKEAFALFDDHVQQCFSECTAVDASASTWQQAQLGGLRASAPILPFTCSIHSFISVFRPFPFVW